jgi:RNA polymerase sigma-70 factor (ECF subfamily)
VNLTETGNNDHDRYLVNKVLAGDNALFGTIIKNTETLVAQVVMKMVTHAEDRKDLAQEIYLKAFKNLGSFKFKSKLSTWIAQIAYNSCFDYLRRRKLVLSDADEAILTIAAAEDAEQRIRTKELANLLKQAMDKLTPVYRTLVTLYHQEEMGYREIGQITGLPEGTVKSYLFRARKALQQELSLKYQKDDV